MRGVIVHGVLLFVMLIVGYRVATKAPEPKAELGDIEVFKRRADDVVRVTYQSDTKKVTIERRGSGAGAYWWGTEVRKEKKPKPQPPGPAAMEQAAAASAEKSPAEPKPIREFEDVEVISEFPIADASVDAIGELARMRALRQLPVPSGEEAKALGLAEKTAKLEVAFNDGIRTFTIGGRVSGGSERYALDDGGHRLLILAGALIDPFAGGETGLRLTDPKGFDAAKVERIALVSGTRRREFRRGTGKDERGNPTKTWIDGTSGAPDQTAANFISSLDRLRPSKYLPAIDLAGQAPLVTATYSDASGTVLGTLAFYAQKASAATQDPATAITYYLATPRAHAPGLLDASMAGRVESDLPTVFQ